MISCRQLRLLLRIQSYSRLMVARNITCSATLQTTQKTTLTPCWITTVSLNGTSKNDSNIRYLYADPGGRAVEGLCLWIHACLDCGSVACECCVSQGRGLYEGLIICPEESYWVCVCVCVCVFVLLSLISFNLTPLHLQWVGRKGQIRKERR